MKMGDGKSERRKDGWRETQEFYGKTWMNNNNNKVLNTQRRTSSRAISGRLLSYFRLLASQTVAPFFRIFPP